MAQNFLDGTLVPSHPRVRKLEFPAISLRVSVTLLDARIAPHIHVNLNGPYSGSACGLVDLTRDDEFHLKKVQAVPHSTRFYLILGYSILLEPKVKILFHHLSRFAKPSCLWFAVIIKKNPPIPENGQDALQVKVSTGDVYGPPRLKFSLLRQILSRYNRPAPIFLINLQPRPSITLPASDPRILSEKLVYYNDILTDRIY